MLQGWKPGLILSWHWPGETEKKNRIPRKAGLRVRIRIRELTMSPINMAFCNQLKNLYYFRKYSKGVKTDGASSKYGVTLFK